MNVEKHWFQDRLLQRFLRYVKIDTTSDRHSADQPSTAGQLELGRVLVQEMKDLGLPYIDHDEQGFVFAKVPSNLPAGSRAPPEIGFMAHLDTSDAAPGRDVKPVLHRAYTGQVVHLCNGVVLDPKDFPHLSRYRGDTIITSDGATLLGADDKAGIAEIMVALEYLQEHPELAHGQISIIFTTDEELGLGVERFPIDKFSPKCCYTLDGGEEGTIEAECFEGYKAVVLFKGISIHTGVARGKLVNAIEMAGSFLSMLPASESPQATDGRYGFYFPVEISGSLEQASLELYLRDFEEPEVRRRMDALKTFGRAVEAAYPRGKVSLTEHKQYSNLNEYLKGYPEVLALLEEAIRETGQEPEHRIIRGGTDGARLSELGIPTPNIFTGGQNFHSRQEWIPLQAMIRASQTIINLARLWAEKAPES
ncbi:Peptidase T [subsurface metagenome]